MSVLKKILSFINYSVGKVFTVSSLRIDFIYRQIPVSLQLVIGTTVVLMGGFILKITPCVNRRKYT